MLLYFVKFKVVLSIQTLTKFFRLDEIILLSLIQIECSQSELR